MKSPIFAALLLLAACGRVGEPRPPIIRIPQKIENLSATQSGYTIVLNWTNPGKYVDGNPVTDTGVVHVFRDDFEIGMVAATAAGQPQSFPVDAKNSVGASLNFTVQLVVPKAGKPAPVSNAAPIRPVDVPGSPRNPVPIVDLGMIVLAWEAPALNPGLVAAYVVQRSDKPAPVSVAVPRFEDKEYEPGKAYTYTITAVRGGSPQIPGEGKVDVPVVVIDKTPPGIPAGLQITLIGNASPDTATVTAFLLWEKNTEPDLKGYKVFRSDRPEQPIFAGVANGYTDPDYVPGKGISYELIAEDISGNPSPRSAPMLGP